MLDERERGSDNLSSQEGLEKFATPYTPEKFTSVEIKYLKPFFSNVDQSVFVIQHLPEEVIGALSAKYSRATEGMRTTFLKEYVNPIIHPEKNQGWKEMGWKEKIKELDTKRKFEHLVNYLNKSGGIDYIVNIQRGRKFFDKWLVEFGDDSISEMGGIHLCIEGLSNIATKEIEDQRIGLSPIEKSSRYVSFADKLPDGNYRYVVPGEIQGTQYEDPYKNTMDLLFSTYQELRNPYFDYIKEKYPKGEDESAESFEKSRKAKVLDDLRDLIPFATITNLGLYGNGRAFEYLINRLEGSSLVETQYLGSKIAQEISKSTPSFIRRVDTPMGQEIRTYRQNIRDLRNELSNEQFGLIPETKRDGWVKLIDYSKDGEVDVLTAFLFSGNKSLSMGEVRNKVMQMNPVQRKEIFSRILSQRSLGKLNPKREDVRFKKVPRAFENSKYTLELWARGGDYRDLQRHRMLTQEKQNFTTRWGYDLEDDVLESPFAEKIQGALALASPLFESIFREHPDAAQYTVPFAYIQHWYITVSAKEIYYMGELRTGPQGRDHYRRRIWEVVDAVTNVHPNIFQGIVIDRKSYSLARRESEIWTDKKRKELGV